MTQQYGFDSPEVRKIRNDIIKPMQERFNEIRKQSAEVKAMPTQEEYEADRADESGRFFSGLGTVAVQSVVDTGPERAEGTESRRLAELTAMRTASGSRSP